MNSTIKTILLLVVFAVLSFQRQPQNKVQNLPKRVLIDTLTWKQLGQIKLVKKTFKDYGSIDFPIINNNIKKYNNQKIYLSGFIVPIDNVNYALSKNVFAACFFCGKAGPETIVGLKFKASRVKLRTDQYVTLQGIFKVNENNPDNWMYNLENTVIIK